jgi:transporter family protein
LLIAWAIAFLRGGTSTMNTLSKQNLLFLCLSGIATGLPWIFILRRCNWGKSRKLRRWIK